MDRPQTHPHKACNDQDPQASKQTRDKNDQLGFFCRCIINTQNQFEGQSKNYCIKLSIKQ